ncbi:MAG: hypothetical protein JXA28_05755, partial [Bacteroidetes bacterium]|nr:hypothetical protein [Bacteroidota bacterium]
MQHLVYVNGEYYPAREARIPALDAGVQFGAGLFETLLATDHKDAVCRRWRAGFRRVRRRTALRHPVPECG